MATMLNQTLWKNSAWVLHSQLRTNFWIHVCSIRQCCALNKETETDDFDSLAVSSVNEAEDVCSKAELSYFATEAPPTRVQPPSKYEKPPLRQTLQYTNKALFGPLLESAAEKRRRIKAEEEDEDGSTRQRRKHKKHKKKKADGTVEPLIRKPENAHFLGHFPGSELKYIDNLHKCIIELEAQNAKMVGSPRTTPPQRKLMIFQKPNKTDVLFDKSLILESSNVQKLYVTSWERDRETREGHKTGRSDVSPWNEEQETSVFSSLDKDTTEKPDVTSWNKEKATQVSSSIEEAPKKPNVTPWKITREVIVPSSTGKDTPGIDMMSCNQEKVRMPSSIDESTPEKYEVTKCDFLPGNTVKDSINKHICSGSTSTADSSIDNETEAHSGSSCSDGKSSPETLGMEDNTEITPTAYSSTGSETQANTSSNTEARKEETQPTETSLLHIDNTEFSSVPSIIDIDTITNFPLEKNFPTQAPRQDDGGILTIGMFDGGYQRLPSVSKILEATMPEADRRVLERWKAKMIRELGEEGFEEYRKGLFERGKLLHGCIQSELTGVSPSVENLPTVQGLWTSLAHVLPSITSVSVLESRLTHPYLYYQGAVDCVATYKGMPVLIDWKTSTKPKLSLKSMFDNPLQVVAYLGALNYDTNYQLPIQVQSAMVVVAYNSGLPAHVHIIDKEKCESYWRLWCARLVQFWRRLQVKNT